MEYEHELPVKVLHSDDDKVRISKFLVSAKCMHDILEQKQGNQLMDARRQHNMTILSSSAYFVRNILAKTLVSLSPNNNSSWSMNLQPYSCSSASFIIYVTFLTLSFDPGIHDIPLPYGANVTMFTESSFPPTYVLIVTLWGAQVCGLGLKHVHTDEYEHFSSSLEVFLALNPVSLVRHMWITQGNVLLEDMDLDCADIIELEKARQWRDLELIPLTNFTSLLVMPVVKLTLTITYSEGHLSTRYYEGDKYIDTAERLSQAWRVDVQLTTGTPANFQMYTALLKPHTNCTANFLAAKGSSYARLYNYACIRKVCNKREVVLFGDMAHICGLVAIGVIFSPFKYAIVFTCAIQFMGAKVCTPVVLEKILFAYEGFDNEKHIFLVVSMLVVVARSTLDHMQFFCNIAQFGLVVMGGEHASKIILDSNLEDKVLIEDESIVMNQAHPNITHVTIGPRRAIGPKTSKRAKLIWDPG